MSRFDIYQPFFLQVYESSGSALPIEVWKEVVGQNLPVFASEAQIYNPAVVRVRLTEDVTDPEGVVQIEVALSDANWYQKLTQAVGEMVGRTNVCIMDDYGDSIREFSHAQLNAAGDLDVFDNHNEHVFVSRSIAPPKRMASDKHVDIANWFKDVRHEIGNVIVGVIADKDRVSLIPAVAKDGSVQKSVERFLVESRPYDMSWAGFLQTYARDDTVRALSPEKVAAQIAQSVLAEERKGLRANQRQIKTFFDYKRGDAEQLWDEKVESNITRPAFQSALRMYEDITDDAMHKSALKSKVYYIINAGLNASKEQPTPVVAKRKKEIAGEHPLDWYYHKHHFERFGKYPGHVTRTFSKQLGKRPAYTGDPVKAVAAFQLFSGRHTLPRRARPGLVPRRALASPLDPIYDGDTPGLVPIRGLASSHDPIYDGDTPGLVPFRGLASSHDPIYDGARPGLIRIRGLASPLESIYDDDSPGLVPIRGLASSHDPIYDGDTPGLVPIAGLFSDEEDLGEDVFIDDLPE